MKILKPLENILKFLFIHNDLIFLAKNSDLFVKNQLFCEKVKNFNVINNILYLELENQLQIFKEYILKISLNGNYYLSHSWSIEGGIIVLNLDGDDEKYYFIDNKFNVLPVLWNNSFIRYSFKLNFITIRKSTFSFHKITTGALQWQKEFSTDITKIEVWNEKVVLVELSAQFIHQIIALDAETGTVLWEKEGAKMQLFTNELYYLEHTHTSFFIRKYNLAKEELVEYNIIDNVMTQFGSSLPSFSYTINEHLAYLSFTSEKTVMIINLNTLTTQWTHQIETNAWQLHEPRVEGNRLYVLDSDKTLHIFEKE